MSKVVEIWKKCFAHPRLEASNLGRVKRDGKLAKISISKFGYLQVYTGTYDAQKRIGVHRLVLATFTGMLPKDLHAAHRDGNKTNNHLSNLYWATPMENILDSMRLGKQPAGEKHGCAKLSSEQVAEIRKKFFRTSKKRSNIIPLAKEYGVDRTTIARAVCKKHWKQPEEVLAEIKAIQKGEG